jgi:hypothetical protein
MKTRLLVTGSLIALLAAVPSVGARAQGGLAPAGRMALRANRRERHPELRQALRALQRARLALQHADRDFGGRRAHAVDLTDQAIREVQAALNYDRR